MGKVGRPSKFNDKVKKSINLERSWLEKIEKIMNKTGLNFSEVVRKSLKPVISLSQEVNLNQYTYNIETESIFQVKQQLQIMEQHTYSHLSTELQIIKDKLSEVSQKLNMASHRIHSNTMQSQSIINNSEGLVSNLREKCTSLIDLIDRMKDASEEGE